MILITGSLGTIVSLLDLNFFKYKHKDVGFYIFNDFYEHNFKKYRNRILKKYIFIKNSLINTQINYD